MLKIEKSKSISLGIIHSVVAISAIPSGLLMMVSPDGSKLGIPLEILEHLPFTNFLIPGMFLFIINGLGQGFVALSSFWQLSYYITLSLIFGIVLMLWIIK